MRVYLDLCCLKRPFDLQEQPLVRLQTEAILSILALPSGTVELLRSEALVLENSLNPNHSRREAVSTWLFEEACQVLAERELSSRIKELQGKGFKSFDALHLASAELAKAATLLTVDLPLLKLAARVASELRVAVRDPIQFIEEIAQWKH